MQAITLRRAEFELPATVFRPNQAGAAPAVVVASGGLGPGDVDAYRWAGERLAAAGYVAIVATYSVSGSGSDVLDLMTALDWLEADAGVDSSRLGLLGHSRGGLSGLLLAGAEERIKAVVSVATPADLGPYIRGMAGYAPAAAAAIAQFLGGSPDEVPQVYDALSAKGLAGRVKQPVLLIHGTADMRVPIEYAKSLESALRESGNEQVEMVLLPGVGHSLELGTLGYQFDKVIELASSWFDKHLA